MFSSSYFSSRSCSTEVAFLLSPPPLQSCFSTCPFFSPSICPPSSRVASRRSVRPPHFASPLDNDDHHHHTAVLIPIVSALSPIVPRKRPVQEDVVRNFTLLKKWMEDNGAYVNKVSLCVLPDRVTSIPFRGLTPSPRKFPEDEQMMAIPHQLVMSNKKAQAHPVIGKFLNVFFKNQVKCTPELQLALWLVYENYLGKKSFFYPYFQVLPSKRFLETTGGPLPMWPLQDIQLLENSYIEDMVYNYMKDLRKAYELVIKEYWESITKLPVPSFADLLYHVSVVLTRSFPYQDKEQSAVLVPCLDLINHSIIYDENKIDVVHDEEQNFVAFVLRTFRHGQMAYCQYGEYTNLELLMYFGMMIPNNRFDIPFVNIEYLLKEMPEPVANFYVVDRALLPDKNGKPSVWQQVTQPFKNMILSIYKDYVKISEKELWQRILDDTVTAYSTTEHEDQAMLETKKDFRVRPYMARRYLLMQKQMVQKLYGEFGLVNRRTSSPARVKRNAKTE